MLEDKTGQIPAYTKEAIDLYVTDGILPGGFLTSVITNDLKGAFSRADDNNRAALESIVRYIMWEVPSDCQGAVDKVLAWTESGGIKGQQEKREASA